MQEYTPHMGALDRVRKGTLVSMADGRVTGYATNDLQVRAAAPLSLPRHRWHDGTVGSAFQAAVRRTVSLI